MGAPCVSSAGEPSQELSELSSEWAKEVEDGLLRSLGSSALSCRAFLQVVLLPLLDKTTLGCDAGAQTGSGDRRILSHATRSAALNFGQTE